MRFAVPVVVRRVAGVGAMALAVVAGGLVSPSPAGAIDSSVCPYESSTCIVTAGVLDSSPDAYKFWVYTTGDDTYICFGTGAAPTTTSPVAAGVLRLTNTGMQTAPTVIPVVGSGRCATTVVTVSDPVLVDFSFGADPSSNAVCIGVNDVTVTVTVSGAGLTGGPAYELWFDTNSDLLLWYCGFVLHEAYPCWGQPRRIV